jgi:hypothetical protein
VLNYPGGYGHGLVFLSTRGFRPGRDPGDPCQALHRIELVSRIKPLPALAIITPVRLLTPVGFFFVHL